MLHHGRELIPGVIKGRALVSRGGFNPLASFCDSLENGAGQAVCADKQNPDLFGRALTGAILCVPNCVGSTTAGPTWERIAELKLEPSALLVSGTVDPLTAGGLILVDIWLSRQVVLIDRLGAEFLASVRTGCCIEIQGGGMVAVKN